MSKKPTILVNGEPLAGPLPLFQRWGRAGVREGTKTQTRRVVKPQPVRETTFWRNPATGAWFGVDEKTKTRGPDLRCPHGKAGEVRYLREPLVKGSPFHPLAFYANDRWAVVSILAHERIPWRWKRDTLSHVFMPREAARTFVRMLPTRCERVQDITENDIIAEGVGAIPLRTAFEVVWDSIHGKGAWARNEWVFVPAWELLRDPKVEVQDAH